MRPRVTVECTVLKCFEANSCFFFLMVIWHVFAVASVTRIRLLKGEKKMLKRFLGYFLCGVCVVNVGIHIVQV